ncbi:MAG: thermonuclease family protein [Phycisphaerales bacterium]|nr:thermonuclease family protein [Hyphomonadaceae bacterium]
MTGLNRHGWLLVAAAVAVMAALFVAIRAPDAPEPQVEASFDAEAATTTEIVGVAIVADGDTIRVGPRHIRFDGIDSPVQGSMCGDVNIYRAAGNALREVTASGEVRCRISDQPDTKGRDMAQCRVGETDLNEYMVSQGWARDWPLHSNGAYADEEAAARAAQLGVWGPSCPSDMWGDERDYSQ